MNIPQELKLDLDLQAKNVGNAFRVDIHRCALIVSFIRHVLEDSGSITTAIQAIWDHPEFTFQEQVMGTYLVNSVESLNAARIIASLIKGLER